MKSKIRLFRLRRCFFHLLIEKLASKHWLVEVSFDYVCLAMTQISMKRIGHGFKPTGDARTVSDTRTTSAVFVTLTHSLAQELD